MGAAVEMLETRSVPSPAPASWAGYLLVAARFVAGYILAVGAGAIVFALLLQLPPHFEAPHFPHSSTSILELMILCFVLGAIFGLPYTILGSLTFRFLLPRKTPVFLLIGIFCPMGALLTMDLIGRGSFWWWEAPFVLLSLPAGLIAAYVYGAVGFGQGFGRWRFG